MNLTKLFFDLDKNQQAKNVEVMIGEKVVGNVFKQTDTSCEISFNNSELINTGGLMSIKIS
ncbi:MAG: hypothetical protein M3R50_10905 [Bacteroidota bacterium]|nr:hypothetical protein [Bacteroidota bacterium]